MSEWVAVKLGDHVNLLTGFPFKSKEYTDSDEDIKLLRGDNIAQGYLRWENVKRWKLTSDPREQNYLLKVNDVILAMDRPWIEAGLKYSIVSSQDLPCLLVQRVACLRAKETLDQQYLRYVVGSKSFTEYVCSIETGTAVPHISGQQIKDYEFALPPLPEQKAIASVLSSLDDKIDLLHRQNKTLEAMAETLFRQWFIEEAKEDWEEVSLGSLFTISSGKGLKRDQFSDHGLIPVLGANGVIGRTDQAMFEEFLIYTGRVGTLGKVSIIEGQPVWLSDNTLVFRDIEYFYFTYFHLKAVNYQDYNVGSTQPLIRQSDIKEIAVLLPSDLSIIKRFEFQAKDLFGKIQTNRKQIQTLENLRDTLLPKLMSGEVRVQYQTEEVA